MIKAVLFDMDGLLVDTETLGIQVAVKICKELGINLTPEEQKSFIGVTDEKFYRELFKKRNLDYNVQEVREKHFGLYETLLNTNLKPFVGARGLPQQLRLQGYKVALVSGSTAKQIDIIMKQLGIKGQFEVIISFEDITHSKPDPESYLLAAQKLGVLPEDCVVLEDAEAGVRAAKAAGMRVIGVTNNGGQDLSLADILVNNLEFVADVLDKM